MKCPSCGRKVEKTWNFCRYCRYDLRQKSVISKKQEIQTGQKKCPRCNTLNAMKNKFCLRCGFKFPTGEDKAPSSKTIEPVKYTTQTMPQKTIQQETMIDSGTQPYSHAKSEIPNQETSTLQPINHKSIQTSSVTQPSSTIPYSQTTSDELLQKSTDQVSVETSHKAPVLFKESLPKDDKIKSSDRKITEMEITTSKQEKGVVTKEKPEEKEEDEFEYINWIKLHGLRSVKEIRAHSHDNCDMLNTYLFNILAEIREYNEWAPPDPENDKKYLQKYGKEIEEYAKSIDCKKFDDKNRCKAIIQTFIDSLNEAIKQLIALI